MRNNLILCFLILFCSASGQVPVNKEPHHHVVLENSKARILNVVILPGDTTGYHIHSTPSLFIGLSKTKMGSQLIHQHSEPGMTAAGTVNYENLSAPHKRIHRVWNSDTCLFHVIDVELLARDSGFLNQPFNMNFTRLEIDNPWVRAYRTELANNQEVTIHEMKRSILVVAINDSRVQLKKRGEEITTSQSGGTFYWMDPGERLTIKNVGDSKAGFVLVELN